MSGFLKGRLGLETARIPHVDRHGLLWLSRGNLSVEDGTLHFIAAATPEMKAGNYQIPFQTLSAILLGPGGTISHDALRLLARHGAALLAIGEGGFDFIQPLLWVVTTRHWLDDMPKCGRTVPNVVFK